MTDGDLLDAGMIFGTGFAPFRGGPMQYIHHEGSDKLKKRLESLEKLHGSRFKPDILWDDKETSKASVKEDGHVTA